MTPKTNTNLDDQIKEDAKGGEDSRWQDSSLVRLLIFSIVAGLVIVAYVLIIVKVESTQKKVDPFENAILKAADDLTKITVSHPRFGIVGLTNTRIDEDVSYSMEPPLVRSINSINHSIKVASSLATELNSNQLFNLLDEDLITLELMEQKLSEKLNSTIAQTKRKDKESIYSKTFLRLKKSLPSNNQIIDLKLTLGGYGKSSGRATFIKAQNNEQDEPFVEHGFYKENFAIPVTNEHYIRFYKIYNSAKIAPSKSFILKSKELLPSAILLEAKVETKDGNNQPKVITKTVCSLIGKETVQSPPTCLALRFPQGAIKKYDTLMKFVQETNWQEDGNWAQAIDAEVPGEGSLNPTIDPVLNQMSSSSAISIAIYNWVKSLQQAPDASRIIELLNTKFLDNNQLKESKKEINSCLAFDTGARQRAFIKGASPGGLGQLGLWECFEFPGIRASFPSSSIPIIVDKNGKANLSGRSTFNQALVQNYLDSIHTTNLCAIETMAQAKLTLKNYQAKLNDSTNSDQVFNKKVIKIARQAGKTGLSVATSSFEIAQRNFSLLKNGLHQVDKPSPVFLLGRKLIFDPINAPLTQEDILSFASNKPLNETAARWLAPKNKILSPWQTYYKSKLSGISVEGEPLDLILAEMVHPIRYRELTVLFDSRDLLSKGLLNPHTAPVYPFEGEPLRKKQALFYSPNAIATGENPKVMWSLLIKDNSFHKNTDLKGTRFPRKYRIWCNKFDPPFSIFPTLAAEIQLRRPLPFVENVPISTLVVDPQFDRKVPLVPPVPGELM